MTSVTMTASKEGLSIALQKERVVCNYHLLKMIGNGRFGVVFMAKCLRTGAIVALKFIDKSSSSTWRTEVEILTRADHRHVLGLLAVEDLVICGFQCCVLVTEYCAQGDLFDYIFSNKKGRPSIKEIIKLFAQIVDAVAYLHTLGVVHRDLKPENILVSADGTVRVADFGFACFLRLESAMLLDHFCGSVPYTSPEIIKCVPYMGPEVDSWSLGVMLYVLLTGFFPFEGNNDFELHNNICAGKWSAFLERVDPNLVDFLNSSMCVSRYDRITVLGMSRHPLLNSGQDLRHHPKQFQPMHLDKRILYILTQCCGIDESVVRADILSGRLESLSHVLYTYLNTQFNPIPVIPETTSLAAHSFSDRSIPSVESAASSEMGDNYSVYSGNSGFSSNYGDSNSVGNQSYLSFPATAAQPSMALVQPEEPVSLPKKSSDRKSLRWLSKWKSGRNKNKSSPAGDPISGAPSGRLRQQRPRTGLGVGPAWDWRIGGSRTDGSCPVRAV